MHTEIKNTKRLAKNTIILYFRMLILLVVSLYTSRVVLANLGVENFGIYSAVGGIVVALGFLNVTMTSATQRFINVAMGKGNDADLQKVFANSVFLHFGIAVVILILSETLGLWFLNSKMDISDCRIHAANYVYQFSIALFLVNLLSVPYNALIIAHERMKSFAYIGLLDAFLKLAIAYSISKVTCDSLVFYAAAMFVAGALNRVITQIYCTVSFSESKIKIAFLDKKIVRSIMSFSVWTLLGALRSVCHSQGMAIMLNVFFGVFVNAAIGVANQVDGIVRQFVSNFLTALNPQVVKCYASENLRDMHELILRGGRMAFCLVSLFVLPLILETPTIISLWLKNPPEDVSFYVRMVLAITFFDCVSSLLQVSKGATGNIKNYQIIMAVIGLTHLPVMWVLFKIGYGPRMAMYVYLVIIILLQVARTIMTCRAIQLSLWHFFTNVYVRSFTTIGLASIIPAFLHFHLGRSIKSSVVVCACSVFMVCVVSWLVTLSKDERISIIRLIKKKMGAQNGLH